MSNRYIDVQTLRRQLADATPPTLIDVRGDEEFVAGHIPGARHIPGDQLASRLAEVPPERPVVTY